VAQRITSANHITQEKVHMPKPELLTTTPPTPESPKPKCRWLTREQLDVEKGIHYSDQHLKRLEAKGLFPRRVSVGDNRRAWVEAEIDDYQEQRNALRDAAPSEAPKRPVPPVPQKKPARSRKPAKLPARRKDRGGRKVGEASDALTAG
jgi:predicted DNA-binding transcriptional regulator AlpA